ncbi:hypothetical protein IWW42_004697 [Coemansia sp. RSA 1085]|nr:hypothetical protein IWW42_004697 [Coemansia sp. RSA 1085]
MVYMAQGAGLKKKTVIKSPSASSSKKGTMKRGRVAKAAKKQSTIKQEKLRKKLSAGITNTLEQAMAAKAGAVGKLTIMKDAQKKGKSMEMKKRKY